MFTVRFQSLLITFCLSVKFLPTYSSYQLNRDRPLGRSESSCQVFGTGFLMITGIPGAIGSQFKGSYSGLGQVAEINHNEVGRDGLQVARPHGHTRSGRYS